MQNINLSKLICVVLQLGGLIHVSSNIIPQDEVIAADLFLLIHALFGNSTQWMDY